MAQRLRNGKENVGRRIQALSYLPEIPLRYLCAVAALREKADALEEKVNVRFLLTKHDLRFQVRGIGLFD
jgi:hypothetical protein